MTEDVLARLRILADRIRSAHPALSREIEQIISGDPPPSERRWLICRVCGRSLGPIRQRVGIGPICETKRLQHMRPTLLEVTP